MTGRNTGLGRWPENLERGKMKIVTINVPSKWLDIFDKLQKSGLFPSRSEAVRSAIRDFMDKQFALYTRFIEPMRATEDINYIRVPNGDGTYKLLQRIGEA